MRWQHGSVEEKIEWIASRAHGVATRSELLAAGVSEGSIERRVRKGLLLPVHRGVYRVGHRAPSTEARYMAAVKACGDGAVLSGRAAGHLHCLTRGPAPSPEVTTPGERHVKGVRTRVSRHVEATTHKGIPVTTVPRTLVDMAADLTPDELARACHEAGVRYGTTPRHVEAVLKRRPRARGAGRLRSVMRGDTKVTLSKLERRLLELLTEAGLPPPQMNKPAGGRRVDCRWPDRHLTVELDGYTYHRSRFAWEQDRRREREARARGDELRRYTWADVFEDPGPMLRELRELL